MLPVGRGGHIGGLAEPAGEVKGIGETHRHRRLTYRELCGKQQLLCHLQPVAAEELGRGLAEVAAKQTGKVAAVYPHIVGHRMD